MKIKKVEFEVNGRIYFLSLRGMSIVFSNDLEVIGRFIRTEAGCIEGATQIFKFCNGGQVPGYGDFVEYQSLLKSMI